MDNKTMKDFWKEFEKTGTKIVFEMPEFKKVVNKSFVKELRNNLGFTQQVFGNSLGVTKKAIEKWEQGANPVSGPTARLMYLLNDNNELIKKIYNVEIAKFEEVRINFQTTSEFLVEEKIPFIQTEKPISFGISFKNVEPVISVPNRIYQHTIGGCDQWTKKSSCQSSIC